MRFKRIKKFKTNGKKLAIAAQIVAIWYLVILIGSYLTSYTDAYLNDVKKISGKISTAKNFCGDLSEDTDVKSKYRDKFCIDHAKLDSGSKTNVNKTNVKEIYPDSQSDKKNSDVEHTNTSFSEISDLKEKHTNKSINLTWSNPNGGKGDFNHVNVYRNEGKTPIGSNIKNETFEDNNLIPATMYIYKITTVDKSGNESGGTTIEITASETETKTADPKS